MHVNVSLSNGRLPLEQITRVSYSEYKTDPDVCRRTVIGHWVDEIYMPKYALVVFITFADSRLPIQS